MYILIHVIQLTIDENGNAHFTERWTAHIYEGTENYIVKENLGESAIENFTVTENGTTFEFLDKWDFDSSQKEKAFKNGIIETKKGVELSWGISEYGTREYILEYTVTNFVKQLKDSQIVHWTFSNEGFSHPRKYVTVSIESIKPLTKEEEKIWAFGYDGEVEFQYGKIVAQTYTELLSDDYVMLFIQFVDRTFQTEEEVNKTFAEVEEEVFAESDYEEFDEGGFIGYIKKVSNFIRNSLQVIVTLSVLIIVLFLLKFLGGNTFSIGKPNKFRRYKEEYYRDYPYDGNFLHAYYIAYKMGLASFDTVLTALLLKWMKEERIRTSEERAGILRRTRQRIHFFV